MDIENLATKLSDEAVPAAQVLLILQTIGVTDGAEGARQTLRLASELHEHFEDLSCLFPQFPIRRFLECRRLYATLLCRLSLEEIAAESTCDQYRNSLFEDLSRNFSPSGSSKASTSRKPKWVALAWVLAAMQSWTPDHSRLKSLFSTNEFWKKIKVGLLSDFFSVYGSPADMHWHIHKHEATPQSIVEWVDAFFKISSFPNRAQPFQKEPLTLSAGAESLDGGTSLCPDISRTSDQRVRRPRNWTSLAERERLINHYSAMPADELIGLCKILLSTIDDGRDGAIEALLATLSILTSKTVEDVLSISINKDDSESIRVEFHASKGANFIVWTRALDRKGLIHKRPPFSVVLPNFIKIPLVGLLQKYQEGTIESCLTVSVMPWAERTYQWIEKHSDVSKASLERQLKHVLSREMYSEGVHSAVIDAFTCPLITPGSKEPRNPLSFYISWTNTHFHLAYVRAVKAIFGEYGKKNDSHLFQKKLDHSDAETVGSTLVNYFKNKIDQARAARDEREKHNWLARYTLLLLIAATAHRSSRTPFFFRHDLLLEQSLAFICDKNAVGSEARFVPIAEIALRQIEQYLKHLELYKIRLPTQRKKTKNLVIADEYIGQPGSERTYPEIESLEDFSVGIFFTIDENGRRKRLGTKELEDSYLSEKKLVVKAFRRQLLTALAEQNICGFDIEALAGHNRDLHIFGYASTWAVTKWADRLRPKIDRHLKDAGWQVIECRSAAASALNLSLQDTIPSFTLSTLGYEGRNRSASDASKRARAAVSAILTREYLEETDWCLDSKAISDIENQLDLKLCGDPDALGKARRELKARCASLSSFVKMGSVPSFNFISDEPGPVDVSFSRHFSIASHLRNRAIARLGRIAPDASPEEKVWERLSHIAFSLVAFDCVLNPDHVRGFIEAIVVGGVYRVSGHLAVRAQAEDRPHRFEKALVLSPITAAQVFALYQLPFTAIADGEVHTQMQKRVSAFVVHMIGRQPKSTWSVNDLTTVFKPYWFVRLPGALYAVATGQTRGPALDLISEVAFLHGTTPSLTPAPVGTGALPPKLVRSDSSIPIQAVALQELKNLFKDVHGSYEKGEQTRRRQNSALGRALSGPFSSTMVALLRDHQIVSLLKDFIIYMRDQGGLKEETLTVPTIRDYAFTIAADLMRETWDKDLTNYDDEEFLTLYRTLGLSLKDKRHSGTVIPLFHRFLRWKINAPHVPRIGLGASVSIRIRASVMTPKQFDEAWNALIADPTVEPLEGDLARLLLTVMYGHGLRPREATGLSAAHVIGKAPHGVLVKKNRIRSVKSRSPRIGWCANLPKVAQRHFELRVKEARLLNPKEPLLFSDPRLVRELYSELRLFDLVAKALRTATGSPSFVNYNLRHCFVTAMATAVMPDTHCSEILSQVRKTVLRDVDIANVWNQIKGGPDGWPFGMELVAMLAGHESSTTTAGSYWHVSHYNLVSFAEHEFRLMKLSDQDVAAMLGVTASAISQSISKGGSSERWSKQRTAIYDRVNRLKVSTAIELVCEPKEIRTKKNMQLSSSSAASLASEKRVDWQRVDLLLGLRLKLNLSMEAFKELLIAEHELTLVAADLLIETYQELLTETGFDDFEPLSSELVATAPKFARGVGRGQDERRRFLANAYQAFSTDPAHMQSLQALCTGWRIHVAADSPFIVAKNPSQALEYVQTLVMLGVAPAQICFHRVNYPKEKLNQLIALGAKEVSYGRTRVSRGPPRLKQKEIALNVEQLRQSRAPDGRDLHRAIFVMSIALKL